MFRAELTDKTWSHVPVPRAPGPNVPGPRVPGPYVPGPRVPSPPRPWSLGPYPHDLCCQRCNSPFTKYKLPVEPPRPPPPQLAVPTPNLRLMSSDLTDVLLPFLSSSRRHTYITQVTTKSRILFQLGTNCHAVAPDCRQHQN